MHFLPRLPLFGLMFTLSCVSFLACSSDGSTDGGVGGRGGSGGPGGGGTGGMGGGGGSGVERCVNASNCDDQEPCTEDLCIEEVCEYPPLPDNTVCASATGLSACLAGECQLIWASCEDEGAEEGDFCQPTEAVDRVGRCVARDCVVGPCEIGFDCWDGNACTLGICDGSDGMCSQANAPNGNACIPPAGGAATAGRE
jgi:hypothetical protein